MNSHCNVSLLGMILLLGSAVVVQAAFYDCHKELSGLRSDTDALAKVKVAHSEKYKFSSECLEILLKKNFFLTSEYLLADYYTKTSIDTEVILRNVANDIKRS